MVDFGGVKHGGRGFFWMMSSSSVWSRVEVGGVVVGRDANDCFIVVALVSMLSIRVASAWIASEVGTRGLCCFYF